MRTETSTPALLVKDVHKSFGKHEVLRGVSLGGIGTKDHRAAAQGLAAPQDLACHGRARLPAGATADHAGQNNRKN